MFSISGVSFTFGGTEDTHAENCHNCVGSWILELLTAQNMLIKKN